VPVRAEAYPTGEFALLRGPLQFVQPVAHCTRETAVATRAGWPDTELFVDTGAALEALPVIDSARADLGFVPEWTATAAQDRPWHESPLRLRREGVALVPLGCAPLRRAGFSHRHDRRQDA
jgi:hypothetical protein